MAKQTQIDIVEAAYDVEAPEDRWLGQIAKASEKTLDGGFGLFAFLYDASVPEAMTIQRFTSTGEPVGFDAESAITGIRAAGGGDYIRSTFRCLQVESVRNTPGFAGSAAEQIFDAKGLGDLVVVNGVDPSGVGMCMGAVASKRVNLSKAKRERYARIASHLANSYRLRRVLAAATALKKSPWNAAAVLSTRGRLDHAGDEEVYEARERLREAAVAIDRARGKLRHVEPDSALASWPALVDGRWSLVDKFDTDGKRYVLARRNEPHVVELELLTHRERTVVSYAAMGHSNKLIAYDLGVAHSTVRVLLARAASKLGVHSRAELVEVARAALEAKRAD